MPYRDDGVGYRDLFTSLAAAPSRDQVTGLRRVVLDCVTDRPAHCDEVARRTGISPFTVRPRLTELRNLGLIEEAGRGRLNSGKEGVIWRVRA